VAEVGELVPFLRYSAVKYAIEHAAWTW